MDAAKAIGAILAAHLETFKLLDFSSCLQNIQHLYLRKGKLVDLAVVQIVSASWGKKTLRKDPRSCCLKYGGNSTKNQ